MTIRISNFLLIALTAISAVGCKTRSSSGLSAASGPRTVSETLDLGTKTYITLKTKTIPDNFLEITAPKAGFMNLDLNISHDKPSNIATPIEVSFYSEDDLNTPLATGTISGADFQQSTYLSAYVKQLLPKAGKYYLWLGHSGQIKGRSASADVSVDVKEVAAATVPPAMPVPGDFNGIFLAPAPVKFLVTAPTGLSRFSAWINIDTASNGLIIANSGNQNTCASCSAKLVITEPGGKVTTRDEKVNGSSFRSDGVIQTQTGTYSLEFQMNVPAGSVITTNFEINAFNNNSGVAVNPKRVLGMIPIRFDSGGNQRGVAGGKPYGFAITSDENSEGRLEGNFEVTRILNNATSTSTPTVLNATLTDASGNQIQSFTSNFNGNSAQVEVINEFSNANYKLNLSAAGLDDAADIIDLNGTLESVQLTLQDGGPAMSTFSDNSATVTVTPPNSYLTDRAVPAGSVFANPVPPGGTLFTPAAAPISVAAKTVLEGMETVRARYHQQIPKVLPNGTPITRGPLNHVDPGTISACLGNEAPHWSDLILHYYCQYGESRSCYTNTIRSKAQALAAVLGNPPSATVIGQLQQVRKESWDECSKKTDEEWPWLVANQGTVFQYVMNSQTFAFDMDQQQAIINKFYRINNPADKIECTQKRPRRAIDPADGTHCLPNKIFAKPLQAAGR